MKAFTVWQPWTTLIVLGLKPYEFRGWAAPKSLWGQRIAIHAGARPVRRKEVADLVTRLRGDEAWTTCLKPEALGILEKVLQAPMPLLETMQQPRTHLPLSHVLGTAILGKPVRSWEIVGEFGGAINDSDRDDHCSWAWPLTDIQPFEPPIEAAGAQGFWDWNGGGHV